MFKRKAAKKYICTECDSSIEIKVITNESEEHNKIQFCPFCGDYLDDEASEKRDSGPLLKDFDDYDEFDEDKYYDDYEDDVDENED
jgi:hypothetical protein